MLHPINDIVVVTPIETTKTKGGLIMPGSVQDSEVVKHGEVFAIGSGRLLDNGEFSGMQVCVGQTVAFINRPKSQFPSVDGKLIMQERDILMIVTEEDDA